MTRPRPAWRNWETPESNHPACPGCGELADECVCPNPDPLSGFRIDRPAPNPFHPNHQKDLP